MSLHRSSCGCEKEIGMSKTHIPQYCEHGQLFVYVHGLKSKQSVRKSRKAMKRSQPNRDWADARRKVDEEQVCRVCGSNENVEAAHVIGRGSDEPKTVVTVDGRGDNFVGTRRDFLYVNPDSIIPLCGQLSQMKCHVRFDAHDLDVLEFLTTAEQVQAVKDAGGIESARRRTSPSSYRILSESPTGARA